MMKYVGWLLTFVAYCFFIFSTRIFQAKDYKYSAPWETFYATVARSTWAAAVGWMIYASVRGFGGKNLFLFFRKYKHLRRSTLRYFFSICIKVKPVNCAHQFYSLNGENETSGRAVSHA